MTCVTFVDQRLILLCTSSGCSAGLGGLGSDMVPVKTGSWVPQDSAVMSQVALRGFKIISPYRSAREYTAPSRQPTV